MIQIHKKDKNNFIRGIVHIQSTFNNTIVTITTLAGDTVSWASAGSSGFKGARKSTPFAAQTAAEKAALEAVNSGIKNVHIDIFICRFFWSSADACNVSAL